MKKAIISLVLVLTLLFSIFAMASCKSNTKTEMPDFQMPENGYDGSAVTIVFYSTMGQTLQAELNKAVEYFNTLYPNITIQHTAVGGYDDVRNQISTELNAQRQPNIAYCYPDHIALYNKAGAVVTLDQFIESEIIITDANGDQTILGLTPEQVDDFVDGYWNEGKAFGDGKMYSLPLSKSTELLFYNKDFFDANNLSVPTTWEEMAETCEAILAIDPNCIPLGYDSEANWFITLCEQYGLPYTSLDPDNHFQFNTEDHYELIEMIREWYRKGYVTTQEIYGAYTSSLFTETGADKVKSYMSIGSSGGTSHQAPTADGDGQYPFEVGIATIPQADPTNPKAISQGPSLCIFQNENPQEVVASWLFMKFLTTDIAFQADFSMASGYVPVIESAKEDAYYQNFLAKANGSSYLTALGASVCLNQADAYFTSPAFNGSTLAREQVGILVFNCLTGNWSDSEVRSKIQKEFENAIAICKHRS